MKGKIALLLALVLLWLPSALADDMLVVNCKEWVSLRESPSTSAKRLMKVPLDAVVTDCEWTDSAFTRCTYEGVTGFILDKYLEPIEADEVEGPNVVLETSLGDVQIEVFRKYDDNNEWLEVRAMDAGGERWSTATVPTPFTELSATDAFMGGTADAPRLMLYDAGEGLRSVDPSTGEVYWTLAPETVRLGASLTHAVDANGTMYIAGYYGPDPVCIDVNGNVIWKSDVGDDDIYWPYEMALKDDALVTTYDNGGLISFDLADGHVLSIEAIN